MSERSMRSADAGTDSGQAGVHPIIVKIAIGAVLWFLAVTWLAFAARGEIDFDLAIVTLFFAIFFTLFLLFASIASTILAGRRGKRACANFSTAMSASTPARNGGVMS
jgi:hypothetical protein